MHQSKTAPLGCNVATIVVSFGFIGVYGKFSPPKCLYVRGVDDRYLYWKGVHQQTGHTGNDPSPEMRMCRYWMLGITNKVGKAANNQL